MSAKKIITVFGATGSQGGSIVTMFLSDPKLKNDWAVRGVTRDVSKESSKKLAARGVEVVAADMNDKATLVKAMQGSDTVFAVTNYWEKPDMALEEQQGRNLADAAKETGVKHYIWSSLEDVTKLSKGVLSNVYHFDSKAHVEEYVRSLGVPATFFQPGYYMANMSSAPFQQFAPSAAAGDAWTLTLPLDAASPIPVFDTADTGKFVKAIVLHRDALLGQRFRGATAYTTPAELVAGFRRAFPQTGEGARFARQSEADFRAGFAAWGAPEFVATEMYENMLLMQDFGYYGGAPLEPSLALVEEPLTTWEQHIKATERMGGLK
ncbi:NMRAL1 protein [Xylariaceae sp. FL0804]|nr:NMRAL1 protein [Xylariaceae sp. FL0804]